MLIVLGPRPDLASAVSMPMFWMKLAAPLALAVAFFATSSRLARPGDRAKEAWVVVSALLLMLWATAAVELAVAPHDREDRLSRAPRPGLASQASRCCRCRSCSRCSLRCEGWARRSRLLRAYRPVRLRAAWQPWSTRCTAQRWPFLFWRSGTCWESPCRLPSPRLPVHGCCVGYSARGLNRWSTATRASAWRSARDASVSASHAED